MVISDKSQIYWDIGWSKIPLLIFFAKIQRICIILPTEKQTNRNENNISLVQVKNEQTPEMHQQIDQNFFLKSL